VKPLVSILVPAHNSSEWIAETLRSALAQTWEQKKIIVVDDGSQDKRLRIAHRFEGQGVRVVAQENRGAAAVYDRSPGKRAQYGVLGGRPLSS
jgi:glycosyltransferase involved in cell wall biosynthesis